MDKITRFIGYAARGDAVEIYGTCHTDVPCFSFPSFMELPSTEAYLTVKLNGSEASELVYRRKHAEDMETFEKEKTLSRNALIEEAVVLEEMFRKKGAPSTTTSVYEASYSHSIVAGGLLVMS